MKKAGFALSVLFTVVIFLSFFLPWVSVGSKQVGAVTKLLTGKSQETIHSISGFQVPVLANGPDARLIISIAKIFSPGISGVDKKSYLIWIVPLLAVIMFFARMIWKNNKWVHLGTAVIGCAIFFVAVWQIKSTDLDKLVLQIRIVCGLWLIFWSYLGIGVLSAWDFIRLIKNK